MAKHNGISVEKSRECVDELCDTFKMARKRFEMVFAPVMWH